MPLYIEGDIPKALTQAGPEFSEDSVWWLFKKLGECVATDFADHTPRVQKVWFDFESEFFDKALAIENEVKDRQGNGDGAEDAGARLTRFMQDNLDVVLSSLRELTAEFAGNA